MGIGWLESPEALRLIAIERGDGLLPDTVTGLVVYGIPTGKECRCCPGEDDVRMGIPRKLEDE